MIDRRIAIFCGVRPKVVERVAPTLRANNIEPVTVSFSGDVSLDYFERLAKRTLEVAKVQLGKGQVRLAGVLVSALTLRDRNDETDAFFPSLRRVLVRPEWANNVAAAAPIGDAVRTYLESLDFKAFVQFISKRKDARLLLPPKNTPSKALLSSFHDIYQLNFDNLSTRALKEVVMQRSTKGCRVANLIFAPALNGERHPVRRCTDTALCDLRATFRFGVHVPANFEFDVSAENSLKARNFYLCDGSAQRVTAQANHLNMRINDDFKEGR